MINKRPRDARPRYRCPECNSSNIYKRSLASKWTKNSRKKNKYVNISEYDDSFKKYRCIVCKNQFDKAMVE